MPNDGAADIRTSVHRFILENYLPGTRDEDLRDDTSLLATGVIDSIGALGLIQFLETRFNLEFLPREVDLDSLENIDRICAVIRRKLATPTPSE